MPLFQKKPPPVVTAPDNAKASSLIVNKFTVTWTLSDVKSFFGDAQDDTAMRQRTSPTFGEQRWTLVIKLDKAQPSHVGLWLAREATAQDVVARFRLEDSLLIRCTVTPVEPVKLPKPVQDSSPSTAFANLRSAYSGIFESASLSDLVFTFPSDGHSPPRSILASKELISARCSYFRSMLSGDWADGNNYVNLPTTLALSASSARKISTWADDDDSLDWLPEEWVEAHGPRAAKVQEQQLETAAVGEGRKMLNVKITDTGYTTYRALLYFLYTEQITFTPLASLFTVALIGKLPDADGPDTPQKQPLLAGLRKSAQSTKLTSRRAFLLDKLETPTRSTVAPASPHAVYALADQLDVLELKKRAKEAIVSGFTVENIMYELISSFSYNYDEIQREALHFARTNWNEVKLTAAWKRVFVEAATIEGGTEILQQFVESLPGSA
ncbi:hypothetical protein JCM8097_003072 [Rhodosporidiobolus ruineniae]